MMRKQGEEGEEETKGEGHHTSQQFVTHTIIVSQPSITSMRNENDQTTPQQKQDLSLLNVENSPSRYPQESASSAIQFKPQSQLSQTQPVSIKPGGALGKMHNALNKLKQMSGKTKDYDSFDRQFNKFQDAQEAGDDTGRKRRRSTNPVSNQDVERRRIQGQFIRRNQTIRNSRGNVVPEQSKQQLGTQYETDSQFESSSNASPFREKPEQKNENELQQLQLKQEVSQKRESTEKSKPVRIPLEKVRSSSKNRISFGGNEARMSEIGGAGQGIVQNHLGTTQNIPGSRSRMQNPPNENMVKINNFLRNAAIKYCQAIYIYYEGDLKNKFFIHSMAPIEQLVEISNKPEYNPQGGSSMDLGSTLQKSQFESFPEWKCAPAFKHQGDIFRLLPAQEYSQQEKVRKIVKTKKSLKAEDMFKYGEYLESLNEEIKVNVEEFQNYKNQYITFGSSVVIMHERSQQFLKISSPSMSDNSFQFKLKLSPHVSEKNIFKILPSNKLQQATTGKIHEYDQIYLAYAYDKILMKDLYLYTDPDRLYKKKVKHNQNGGYSQMVFSEDKKLPMHLGICPSLSMDYSENYFKALNGQLIQIKHIESELYLTMTIKRKENRIMAKFFGDSNRYHLNKLIDYVPNIYSQPNDGGQPCVINIHFESKDSLNTYWKVYASPVSKDIVILENAVSKVKLVPLHLQNILKGERIHTNNGSGGSSSFDYSQFFKIKTENESISAPKMSGTQTIYNNSQQQQLNEYQYLWVEYMKFIKTENRYEFNKFGNIKQEDKANFFDSFQIVPTQVFKQHALEFINRAIVQIKDFDSYAADISESTEYENLYDVLCQLKKFVKNKHEELLNIDAPYGKPNAINQEMIKESYLLEDIVELMGYIWPNEICLKGDMQEDEAVTADVHKEIKVKIAEKIFELLKACCWDNLTISESMFFDIVPSIQKFFGVGFRQEQDFKLFKYLVSNSDKFAEYKEKSKYNIIFQFIKKLFKETDTKVQINIFTILSKFCINSSGEPNNYHQKLLHDLFFYNKMENLTFSMKFGKTKIYRASTFDPTHSKNVIEEEQQNPKDTPLGRMLSERPQERKKTVLLEPAEIKLGQGALQELHLKQATTLPVKGLEQQNLERKKSMSSASQKSSQGESDKLNLKVKSVRMENSASAGKGRNLREDDSSQQQQDQEDQEEKVQQQSSEFLIKQIHDMQFEKITQDFIMRATSKTCKELDKIQMYFFADICYLMNFDCKCSRFSATSVSNIIHLLQNGEDLDTEIKAGIARILNTILRNHNDNIKYHPHYIRIYEKQTFKASKSQDIISPVDVKLLIQLTGEHFKKLAQGSDKFQEYDSEIIRLMAYLIESDLIFSESFESGMQFINEIFYNVGHLMINSILTSNQMSKNRRNSLKNKKMNTNDQCTLIFADFQKQFKKLKKLLQTHLNNTSQGMIENPIAWKCLSIQKQYVSFVEKVAQQKDKKSFQDNLEQQQQEKVRHSIVSFYLWLITLRIEQLISNIINMFHSQLENFLSNCFNESGQKMTLEDLMKKPEILMNVLIQRVKEESGKEITHFFEDVINYNSNNSNSNQYVDDIDNLFNKFMDKTQRTTIFSNKNYQSKQSTEQILDQRRTAMNQKISMSSLVEKEKVLGKSIIDNVKIDEEEKFRSPTTTTALKQEKSLDDDIDQWIKMQKNQSLSSATQSAEGVNSLSVARPRSTSNMSKGKPQMQIFDKQEPPTSLDRQILETPRITRTSTLLQGKNIKFLDILIEMFVHSNDKLFQQEIIKVLFKFMNIKRELLYHFQRTIVIFREGLKSTVNNLEDVLSKCKMLIQDSTIWEMPKENDQKNGGSPPQVVEALEENIECPMFLPVASSPLLQKTRSTVQTQKIEYVLKMKEYQKSQNQIFQGIAFTKSNKTTDMKISKLEEFINYLEVISKYFTTTQTSAASQNSFKLGTTSNQLLVPPSTSFGSERNKREIGFEEELKQQSNEQLLESLSEVQSDLQYAFLAIEGYELLINFMERNKELRQESVRILFQNQKSVGMSQPAGEAKHESVEPSDSQERVQYAYKVLIAYKKCYEILIKFIHNNHTNKQVMLNYLDQILLFNSEYYMQSKLFEEINLYDFDLLNQIIENNYKVKHMSTITVPKIQNLVLYLLKIVEFKKPEVFGPKILKVYSNIIANSDSQKINDLIVDIMLREEDFFKIQGIVLGKYRENFIIQADHFFIIENFLKGIAGILRNQSIRMVKKKFYTIFNKMDNLQSYFDHLRRLFDENIKVMLKKGKEDEIKKQGGGALIEKKMSEEFEEMQFLCEEEINQLVKRFLTIESLYIFIFYQLFFDIKGNDKQIADKIVEMGQFLEKRKKDIKFLNQFIPEYEFMEWTQYKEFEQSIESCEMFCIKHQLKQKSTLETQQSFSLKTQQTFDKNMTRKQSLGKMRSNIFEKKSTFSENKLNQRKGGGNIRIGNFEESESSNSEESKIKEEEEDKGDERNIQQKISLRSKQKDQIEFNYKSKEKLFLTFKWTILHDDSLRQELKNELNAFAQVMLVKFQKAEQNSQDLTQKKYYEFFKKLIDYAHNYNNKNFDDTKLLVEFLCHFIDLTSQEESYKGESIGAKTEIQEKLNTIGAVSMLLELMCSEQNEIIDELFPQLLLFANKILDGAQNNVQAIFTEYLTKNESSINLFQRCYSLIEKEIQLLQKLNTESHPQENIVFRKQATMKDKTKAIMEGIGAQFNQSLQFGQDKIPKIYNKVINVQKQILKFLKNLCENHNTKIQLLIGNQQNHQKNFDMVSLTVNYLHSLISNISMSKRNYTNAKHCCISLAEYVQGPCFVNQNLIKDANFYQLAVQILQMKPYLRKDSDYDHKWKNEKKKEENKQKQQNNANLSLSLGKSQQFSAGSGARKSLGNTIKEGKVGNNEFNMFDGGTMDLELLFFEHSEEENIFKLTNFMIQKLKLMCTIILLSLLEQRTQDDPLLLSMKRSIPLEVIKQNIVYEYFLFCKDYKKFLSRENFFRHVLSQSDTDVKEELIIEVGFNLFFLLKRWSENKKTNDSQFEEMMKLINLSEMQEKSTLMGTFKQVQDFYVLVKDSFMRSYKELTSITKEEPIKEKLHKISSVEKFVFDQQSLLNALNFFQQNSGHIDVLMDGSIEQVYFPYMPYCTYLSEEEKRDFYNNLPTDRDKEKIDALINDSIDLIRKMKIEYQFKKFFINLSLIWAFIQYTELWKTFSFYTIIILNMMNLYSFHAIGDNDRMDEPKLLHYFSTGFTQFIYSIFGFFQIIFALCIDATIISKRIIYHYELTVKVEEEKENNEEQNEGELVIVTGGSALENDTGEVQQNAPQQDEQELFQGIERKDESNQKNASLSLQENQAQNSIIEESTTNNINILASKFAQDKLEIVKKLMHELLEYLEELYFWAVNEVSKRITKKQAMKFTLSSLSDLYLLYYSGYLIFSFAGFYRHPFFYCYHMIDIIIRNPYLKNVLKALYRPRFELLNTLILFLCMEYIFTIIAYMGLYEDYEANECTTLSQCFMVTIDQTFKGDGGLGGFLEKSYPKDMSHGESINYTRFFYDNLFNVLLVILIVEIISGIIIDTFGALREEHNKITESIENKCMICGKNRDFIEREQQEKNELERQEGNTDEVKISDEKAFDYHKKEQHNIYEYIFFLAYLQEKPELEYTGLESFVNDKYQDHNNTWFPIYKSGKDKKEEKSSSNEHGSGGQEDEDDNDDGSGEDNDNEGSSDNGDDNTADQRAKRDERGRQQLGGNSKMILDYLQEIDSKIENIQDRLDEIEGFEGGYQVETEESNMRLRSQRSGYFNASPKGVIKEQKQAKNLFQKHRAQLMAITAFTKGKK